MSQVHVHQIVGVIGPRHTRRLSLRLWIRQGHSNYLPNSTRMVWTVSEGSRDQDGLCDKGKPVTNHPHSRKAPQDHTPGSRGRNTTNRQGILQSRISRGHPEVFQLDLAGMISHINMGKGGIMPDRPLKTGTDLSTAPHVMMVLLGNFKGETGVHHHMVSLASTTMSGIPVRWWLEKLDVQRDEGCHHGPAFGRADGSVLSLHEYDGILHHFLAMIQQDDPELIAASDDVRANYSFFRTFRKTAEGRARAANLDSSIQNDMNRWRTIENAKGGRPCFNIVEHYSHARDPMTVTWRYSYVQ